MTILETNIERILADTLWQEVHLIEAEMKKLSILTEELLARKDKLEKIAHAAELPREGA